MLYAGESSADAESLLTAVRALQKAGQQAEHMCTPIPGSKGNAFPQPEQFHTSPQPELQLPAAPLCLRSWLTLREEEGRGRKETTI